MAETLDEALNAVTVVCGHYGVGKTNLSLNLALDCARKGYLTTLVDLDVVNPYFRSSDHAEHLAHLGIETVAPLFAGTTLDSPGITGRVATAVEQAQASPEKRRVIIDVGGDDVGATALGRFSHTVEAAPYTMLYVVNQRRSLTQTPEDALAVLAEIQAASRMCATGVVGNTHLQKETTAETVANSLDFVRRTSALAGLPLYAVCAPRSLTDDGVPASLEAARQSAIYGIYPVDAHVRPPWDE